MGRKSKLTEERQARLCEALRAGNTRAAAADYAGIGERTLYRWISRAEDEGEGPYWLLWQDIKKAEAAAEVRNVAIIQQAAKKSWQTGNPRAPNTRGHCVFSPQYRTAKSSRRSWRGRSPGHRCTKQRSALCWMNCSSASKSLDRWTVCCSFYTAR